MILDVLRSKSNRNDTVILFKHPSPMDLPIDCQVSKETFLVTG